MLADFRGAIGSLSRHAVPIRGEGGREGGQACEEVVEVRKIVGCRMVGPLRYRSLHTFWALGFSAPSGVTLLRLGPEDHVMARLHFTYNKSNKV